MMRNVVKVLAAILTVSAMQTAASAGNVKVERISGDGTVTIYEGDIQDSGIDIPWENDGEIKPGYLFDWEAPDDEYIRITPQITPQITAPAQNFRAFSLPSLFNIEPMQTMQTTGFTGSDDFDIGVSLMKDGSYCENQLVAGTNLGINIRIKNISTAEKTVLPYIAVFEGGILTELTSTAYYNIAIDEEESFSQTIPAGDGNKKVKIFIWNGEMKPLTEAVTIDGDYQDFYPNSFAKASLVAEGAGIGGRIEGGDLDYLKLVPETTGYFAVSAVNSSNLQIVVYGSGEQELANSNYAENAGLSCRFTAGETYYLRIKGKDQTVMEDYNLTVSYDHPASALTGAAALTAGAHYTDGTITSGNMVIYKFTPQATAAYAFTTTGSTDTVGILYDGDVLISDDNGNGGVNFKIERVLEQNKTYYLKVKHRQNGSGSYRLYVEMPLTVAVQ